MKLEIKHQESYSRGELLLRTFFGFLYIALPHYFVLFFVGIWSGILKMIAFFSVLFTGRYPQSIFEFHVGMIRWGLRLSARIYNLTDGYPAFGIDGQDEETKFEIDYPERLSRGLLLLRIFFGGFYVGLPHGFILFFRLIAVGFLIFLAWWVVLFTGKFPESFHTFITDTIRWQTRVGLYMGFMTDEYPPFTGK